jgi:hypothetical protein
MISEKYRQQWRQLIQAKRVEYEDVLRLIDPFSIWERDVAPEIGAESELIAGLKIAYGEGVSALARRFFERCDAIVERASAERVVESERCVFGFPRNRACLFRAGVYSGAAQGGGAVYRLLHEAALDLEIWCKSRSDRWDSEDEAYHLAGVRLALLADTVAKAREMLASRRRVKWHGEEAAILSGLAKLGILEGSLLRDFESYFDIVRAPDYKADVFRETDILRFELGALWTRFSVEGPGTIDWGMAIDLVSR